ELGPVWPQQVDQAIPCEHMLPMYGFWSGGSDGPQVVQSPIECGSRHGGRRYTQDLEDSEEARQADSGTVVREQVDACRPRVWKLNVQSGRHFGVAGDLERSSDQTLEIAQASHGDAEPNRVELESKALDNVEPRRDLTGQAVDLAGKAVDGRGQFAPLPRSHAWQSIQLGAYRLQRRARADIRYACALRYGQRSVRFCHVMSPSTKVIISLLQYSCNGLEYMSK